MAGASADEAEELIARVLARDDPYEHTQILSDITKDLNHDTLADRMADQGYGAATRATGQDVLQRLQSPQK